MTTPTTPTDAMVEALKPCPFCGEKPVLMRRTWHHNHKIECLNENCSTDRLIIFGNTMEEAVTRWNTRTAALQHREPGGTEKVVTDSCGCVFCDIEIPMIEKHGGRYHRVNDKMICCEAPDDRR